MSHPIRDPREGLRESVANDRVHSAYLLSGTGDGPRQTALEFVRALACEGSSGTACEACRGCRRSAPGDPVEIDGSGKSGPLLRHVGDHPDLVWVERGAGDTRVRIGQIRALQAVFRLRPMEGGRRAGVIADAEWLNQEAQNALLRLLEEPPPRTTLVLVTAQPAGLLATVRSRCQRIRLPGERATLALGPDAPDEVREIVVRLGQLGRMGPPDLLDWAEEFRGPRAIAAASVGELLGVASAWLHETTRQAASAGEPVDRRLEAWSRLQGCRKSLVQRNANPQMVAERALLALQEALG